MIYPPPRERALVWCANTTRHPTPPYGVGVPGFVGGRGGNLCTECEAERLAAEAKEEESSRTDAHTSTPGE